MFEDGDIIETYLKLPKVIIEGSIIEIPATI